MANLATFLSLFPLAIGPIPHFFPFLPDLPLGKKMIMKSAQPINRPIKDKSIASISQQVKPIPTAQLLKLKGGGNPWIDAS